MIKKLFLLTLALWSIAATSAKVNIVPLPQSIEEGKGFFLLTARTPIVAQGDLQAPAALFSKNAARILKGEMPIAGQATKKALTLTIDPTLEAEAYTLTVTKNGISICGSTPQGVFYGLQSLMQLIVSGNGRIPVVTIIDKPCMEYRGAMLDCARHFFPVDDVKSFIDMIALHKLNRFHWHLTEDQGWRIEIKKYPELVKIGSQRKETIVGLQSKTGSWTFDGTPYGGYYTQDDIRAIVAYAAQRYIEVIPEIEMPGHGLGALASYPWLGCTGGPYEVWTRWGISKDVYCAGKESTFEFIENVLTEVLELFPSKVIHIGGDECPKERWKECPACQKRIADQGLANEAELQSYFMHRIEKWLQQHNRTIIGWDEITEGGISKTATIMAWRDQSYGTEAARKGNKVIMAPKWNCYLDYSQTSDPEKFEPLCNKRYLPLRQVYRLDPYDRLRPEERKNIIGVQGNLWSEYVPDMRTVEFQVLPRLAALAETGWSYDRKEYNDFLVRLKELTRVYEAFGYNYAPFAFQNIE